MKTTTLAAMLAGRNSVGYDLDGDLFDAFDDRLTDLPAASRRRVRERLARHRQVEKLARELFGIASSDTPEGWIELNSDSPLIASFHQFGEFSST